MKADTSKWTLGRGVKRPKEGDDEDMKKMREERYEGVVFIPITPESRLKKELQRKEDEFAKLTGNQR